MYWPLDPKAEFSLESPQAEQQNNFDSAEDSSVTNKTLNH